MTDLLTKCPKLGAHQWTCALTECTCHARYSEAYVQTNPAHGGKVNCSKCHGWIYVWQDFIVHEGVWMHCSGDCVEPSK